MKSSMTSIRVIYVHRERENVDFKSREVNCLKECALALRREVVVKFFLPPFGCDSVRPPYVVVDSKSFSMTLSFYFRAIL